MVLKQFFRQKAKSPTSTNVIDIGARAFAVNAIKSFMLPTPQKPGHKFVEWTRPGRATFPGGAIVDNLEVRYIAVFVASE